MAYNVYDDAQKIYQFKQQYDKAKASGDKGVMTNAANSAKWLRDRMAQNGYGDLAKQLEGYNTQQMGDYLKYYPTQGKSSFRDYLKGSKLVTEYGYTPEQIDKMIGFNNATKEITFGGQNVGKADTIVDGVSYFSNDFMDGVIDNHIKHSGVTPKVGATSGENVQKLLGIQFNDRKGNDAKREDLWNEAMANPFETDIGKAIMGDYNLKAMQGRDNEAASGAASNSGNIDSFAAANALRQQASLTAMGRQQAIAAQSSRINDLRGALGDIIGTQQIENQGALSTIGKQADLEQRDFENKQTEKLLNQNQANVAKADENVSYSGLNEENEEETSALQKRDLVASILGRYTFKDKSTGEYYVEIPDSNGDKKRMGGEEFNEAYERGDIDVTAEGLKYTGK